MVSFLPPPEAVYNTQPMAPSASAIPSNLIVLLLSHFSRPNACKYCSTGPRKLASSDMDITAQRP